MIEEISQETIKDTRKIGEPQGKRRARIRTMEKDLKRILASKLGEEPKKIKLGEFAPETLPSERSPSKRAPKFPDYFKIIGALIITFLILGGVVILIYFLFIKQPPPMPTHLECRNEVCQIVEGEGEGEDLCETDEDCKVAPPSLPPSLIKADSRESLSLDNLDREEFLRGLDKIAQLEWPEGTLLEILPFLKNNENLQELLTLSQIIQVLGISMPQEIITNLGEEFTLFAYIPTRIEKNRCEEENIQNLKCWGPRLGLVIKIGNETPLKQALSGWEATMVEDLKAMVLFPVTKEEAADFQDFTYKDFLIRYKNLDISTATINWAIVSNALVIGTSKYSVFAAIDGIATK